MINFEKVFLAVCQGDNKILNDYISKGGDINRRFSKFGREASLLAAAHRCGHKETKKYLLEKGATLTKEEQDVIEL